MHGDGSIVIVHVDDVMLIATRENAFGHWKAIAAKVDFKDEAAPLLRYLGAQYRLDEYDAKSPLAVRSLAVSMTDYDRAAVGRFVEEFGGGLTKST